MFENIDMSGVFGTTSVQTTEGENDPGAAAPENIDNDTSKGEGATEQGAAAPAADTDGDNPEGTPNDKGDKGQSAEDNAAYAAARRKAEQERDDAIAKAKETAAKEVDEIFASAGMVNPYTGDPITNKTEMDAYLKQLREEEQNSLKEDLKSKGVQDEDLQKYVDQHPDVLAARAATAELEKLRNAEKSKQNERLIIDAVQKIAADDPAIKGPQDVLNHPNFAQISEKVKKGYSLEDAYFIVNREAISAEGAKRAEQAALNKANSKNHLQPTHTEGNGGIQISAEKMQELRVSGLSDERIKQLYGRMQTAK